MAEPVVPAVEITQTGPGGLVVYTEGELVLRFSWEFAASPALALVFGPPGFACPGGRRAEIYGFVAAEVVRQKAAGRAFEIDLESGIITILERTAVRRDAAPG